MKRERAYNIPSMTRIMEADEFRELKARFRLPLLKRMVQQQLSEYRRAAKELDKELSEQEIISYLAERIKLSIKPSLKPVINATGVILHTNLGRAPLGEHILDSVKPVLTGYCNLEFDLEKGMRGSRNSHLSSLLKIALGCDDSIIVNNNAAALFLILSGLAENSEVIVSRGELVEIGGSFRIPDIIAAGGAKIVEVGTTNKTKAADYVNAINENTSMILKVHKSNYYMQGFTEEVELAKLAEIARLDKIHLVYDLGTGFLDSKMYRNLESEPDVQSAIKDGADLVCFSCDKILGGVQGGIIAGDKTLVKLLARHPLMRVLRVDKLTISTMTAVLTSMLYNDEYLAELNPVWKYINRGEADIAGLAESFAEKLESQHLKISIVDNKAQCGGGTLPYHYIDSRAILVEPKKCPYEIRRDFAEKLHRLLLDEDLPILAILRERKLLFDVLTLEEKDIEIIAATVKRIIPFW